MRNRSVRYVLVWSVLLGLVTLGGADPGRFRPPRAPDPRAADELLVRWVEGQPPAVLPGSVHRERLAGLGVDRYTTAAGQASALATVLRADPRVEFVEPNHHLRPLSTPNDPLFANQWNLRQIGAVDAWDIGTGGPDVIVAILDSGIDPSHPDLVGRVVPGRNVLARTADTRDDIGHGTLVAGIVGGQGNNQIGVAGLSWGVRLMPIKITDRFGDASIAAAAEGIRWAAENGARIINLSFGGLNDSQTVRRAVAEARARGVLLVAAAGNCGEAATYRDEGCDTLNPPIYPAALEGVIAVGALTAESELAPYSETGEYIRLTAPGGLGGSSRLQMSDYVLSTWPPQLPSPIEQPGYNIEVGTSMAAPHVAGTAALVWSLNPSLTRDQLETILFETADDLGVPGRDERHGFGRVNALRAVQRAATQPGNRAGHIQIIVDQPQPDAVVPGPVAINGWAVDALATTGTGIDLVEAYLDGPPGQGRFLGRLPYGQARPDVARLLDRGGFANAGFQLAAPDVAGGVRTLWIRAHSALSGAWATRQVRFIALGSVAQVSVPTPRIPPER